MGARLWVLWQGLMELRETTRPRLEAVAGRWILGGCQE